MKKLFLHLAVLFALVLPVFSQSEMQQAVSPRTFYVGDLVEIRFSFKSGVDFFSDLDNDVMERSLDISKVFPEIENDDFTLVSADLYRSRLDYSFIIRIVPWKSGIIKFPPVSLYQVIYPDEKNVSQIKINPIEVSSLISENTEMTLRPGEGPLLVPGTIYFVWAVVVFLLIIIALIVRCIIKWSVISKKINEYRLLWKYARNARHAIKAINKLLKEKEIEDSEFCNRIQKILRKYLSFRFGTRFEIITTSSIMKEFDRLTAGTMSDFMTEQIENLCVIFHRTDYIRYAAGSIDSKRYPQEEYEAVLHSGEKESLTSSVTGIIKNLETGVAQ